MRLRGMSYGMFCGLFGHATAWGAPQESEPGAGESTPVWHGSDRV